MTETRSSRPTTTGASTVADQVWFTTAEAAGYCRMSTRQLMRYARDSRVTGEQVAGRGGHWRFHRDWLDAFLGGR